MSMDLEQRPADAPIVQWQAPDRAPSDRAHRQPPDRLRVFAKGAALGFGAFLPALLQAAGDEELGGVSVFAPLAAMLFAAARWRFTGWFGSVVGGIAAALLGALLPSAYRLGEFEGAWLVLFVPLSGLAVAIALLVSAIRRRWSSNRRLRHSAYAAGVGNEVEFIAGVRRQWQRRTGKPIAPDELDRVLNLGWHDEE